MIRRKQAKIITSDEFLSKQQGNAVSCDIENVLCKDYVYLLDSMDIEDFEYEDTSFDVFAEIVYKSKVVGFASYMDEKTNLLLMEIYVMPEYRGNGLLFDEISSKEDLVINNPKIPIVKSLIEYDLATELSDGIVISKIPLTTSFFTFPEENLFDEYYSYVYDLNSGSVLFLDKETIFNSSEPNRFDIRNNDLSNVNEDYLNKACEIVSDFDKKYLKVSKETFSPTIVFV